MSGCQTILLPPGVKHWTTMATAESWAAWDALEWEQRSWIPPKGVRLHTQKEVTIDGKRIVVFPPHEPREAAA
jgi:hypothetical protein